MNLDELGMKCHATAVASGFWDGASTGTPDFVLAKLCLIHSEVSEVMEAYRKQHGPVKLTEEFADIIIRVVDLWAGMYGEGMVDSLDESISNKMSVNSNRPYKHGNLI